MERWHDQRQTINQLHFIYQWLRRTLPKLTRRVTADPVVQMLEAHRLSVKRIDERLKLAAHHHGQPPQPCFNETANPLLSEFYAAERKAPRAERAGVVVKSLQLVREYLLETWNRLNDTLTEDENGFRNEVKALMRQEEELYKELVALRERVGR
ncbi:MAG: hypothetical protein IPG74_05700 [Flavobacteriales bacterium]|nr:hypothetical protein [Flavobacteriales bacterium]